MVSKAKLNTDETLGERLRRVRQELGMTQVEVAKRLNVTPGFICNMEKGRTSVSLKLLILYARLMHTTLDSIVGTLDPVYRHTAQENELLSTFSKMDPKTKIKILETMHIWCK